MWQYIKLSEQICLFQAPKPGQSPQRVAAARRAVLQCSSAYCGISGNEQAVTLAKEGAGGEQHNNVSFREKKTLIRALMMPKSQREDYHRLSREQQVVLVRPVLAADITD